MPKIRLTRLFVVLLLFFSFNSYGIFGRSFSPFVLGQQVDKAWTFMVYLDADNNLEEYGASIFLEMASVGSTADVNIVVQMDRVPGYDTSYDNWTDCKRFYVTSGLTPTSDNAVEDLGEVNMGDPNTLADFVNWAVIDYPANRYCLVLYDHGSGCVQLPLSGEGCAPTGICFDDTSGDVLTLMELSQAFAYVMSGIDIVFFDACDMCMIEVVYQMKDYTDIMVGSEEVGWTPGPYDNYLSYLVDNPSISPSNFASVIVTEYINWAPFPSTMSAIDLSQIQSLVTATSNFAQNLKDKKTIYYEEVNTARDETEGYQGPYLDYYGYYIDLYHFAQLVYMYIPDGEIRASADTVMDYVSNAVIISRQNNRPNSHGLSIFFPDTEEKYNKFADSYKSTTFSTSTQWDEFIEQCLLVSPTDAHVDKPIYPIKIRESEIPIGANGTYHIYLRKNCLYHAYCHGKWIDDSSDPETDYDIYVYDPLNELVSCHTEAAGLPEHLGTTVDHPFFIPEYTGEYRFVINNDARESEAAEEATLMVIQHVECNQWYKQVMQGKDENGNPVEKTSWAFEFYTTSKHVEAYIEVPDTLDMYEARLYPVANPSKKVGVPLNGVPLAWEPGLYGEVNKGYGGYNLDSKGFRFADAVASCEHLGQNMLINYTHSDDGTTLYHLVLIAEKGSGEINFKVKTDFSPGAENPTRTDFVPKPVLSMKIEESQIPIGENWTYVCSLNENRSYHVYCYGDWIDYEKDTAKTDYDIYVYDPYGELVSSHTEAAGLPEHLGTTIDQPFFTAKHTGNYTFVIKNDPKESNGEKEATLMVIEHVGCNEWHQRYLHGKVDDEPVEDTSWAYEFCSNSERIEVLVDVPPDLDMYEARIYLMANPSRKIGTTLNGVPLAWEPGLYGEVNKGYGGYNLDSKGFRFADAVASCEHLGQNMLINYTSLHGSDFVLYHLVLIAELGEGNVRFLVKTDFNAPEINIKDPVERAYPSNDTMIFAQVIDENRVEKVWLAYTNDDWSTSTSIDLVEGNNRTYAGNIPKQLAGMTVKYKVLATDTAENQAETQGNYTVKNPTQIEISLSKYICDDDKPVAVNGLISHGGATVTVEYTFDEQVQDRSTVQADSSGVFSDDFVPSKSGVWTVSASWQGNQTCFGAVSNHKDLTVSTILVSFTCNVTEEITVGENVTVTGSTDPTLNFAFIRLVFTRPNGSTTETSVYTNPDGTFTTNFKPDYVGSWKVTAKFDGDGERFAASESYPSTFLVKEPPGLGYDFYIYIMAAVVAGAVIVIMIARMYRSRVV